MASRINISKEHKRSFLISTVVLIVILVSSFFLSTYFEDQISDSQFTKNSSLLTLSILIGLVDGFNPCAMWILIYLISLVSQLRDRKKMWLIAGTFLLASGIIYFVILSMWLNGWNYMKYIVGAGWILKGAGIFALLTGAYFVFDFVRLGGRIECSVGDMKSRKNTRNKIKEIVNSPFTVPIFFALIFLAFAVNLTEFLCSIGLPALFTQVLSVSSIDVFMKYLYILIYTLAFMADDLLIFYLGLKAVESPILDKYSGLGKIVGGILMLILGVILLFFPQFLV